jgi:hypothetical protein
MVNAKIQAKRSFFTFSTTPRIIQNHLSNGEEEMAVQTEQPVL